MRAREEICMNRYWIGALLIGLALPATARAIRCSDWNRMDPGAKAATIDRMISSGIRGSEARRYDINRARTEQCMRSQARSIQYDFDGACAEGQRAEMSVLDDLFKQYAWSCLQ
jgi:hypothetical protein